MRPNNAISNISRIFALMCGLALIFTGCGSGGSNNTPGTITGQAAKGPVSGGTVTAHAVTSGAKGNMLGTARTDVGGNYNLSVGNYSGPVFLEIMGGSYTDEATGATIHLPTTPGSGLQAVMDNVTPGDTLNCQITPLTTMAAALAEKMTGGITAANINAANHQVGTYFGGIDIVTTRPINPILPGSATGATQEAINYGLILGGLSQQAKALNLPNPLDLISALVQDISDGTFNGQAGSTPAMLNGSPMDVTTGNANLATAIDTFSQDTTRNISGGSVSRTLITLLQNSTDTLTAPGAPTGVSVTAGDGQVTVNWNAASGATSYNLYMASQSGVTRSNYSTLTDGMKHTGVTNPFVHTGLTNGTTYYVVVTAVNDNGESVESSEQAAVPLGGNKPAVSVTIEPSTATLIVGENKTFTATVVGSVNTAVVWSVQEGAFGGTITSGGVYTAPSTPGTYHIVATSQADPNKRATATVAVLLNRSGPIKDACGNYQGLATPAEIAQTPKENAEAEQMTLEATDAFIAPQDIYERVVGELAAIRTNYPAVANIEARPNWADSTLIIGFDDEGKAAVRSGTYTDWNCANTFYGMNQIDDGLLDSLGAVILNFAGRFNIPLLAAGYGNLRDVRYVQPNDIIGDGDDVCLSIDGESHFYVFDTASGDCPAGCISHTYRGFSVDAAGHITELGTWEKNFQDYTPMWLQNLSACTRWL